MKCTYSLLIALVALVIIVQGAASALDYLRLTDHEQTRFHEVIKFQTGDTLDGPIHSNSQISIMGSPVFLETVSSCASDFDHQAGYAPQFLGPGPVFNAPLILIPRDLDLLRSYAINQGNLFSPPPHHLCYLRFMCDSVIIFTSLNGVPFDSTDRQTVLLSRSTTIMFFDCPIRVMGRITGRVTVGSSSDINIEDDIRYSDSDSLTGFTPTTSHNFLALAASKDIKISNTVANGRENSNGLGRSQTDLNFTSVVITAALYALGGSLTFENQNDPDSGYDYGSADERGTAWIYGGIVQEQSGYLHRSNRGGTGYLRHVRFDHRLRWWHDYVIGYYSHGHPDTLDFGDLPIGILTTDTVSIHSGVISSLGGILSSSPFHAQRNEPLFGSSFRIPVSITPLQPVSYRGMLTVSTDYNIFQIVLLAHGIPPHSPQLSTGEPQVEASVPIKTSLTASPNPFNLTTELRYTLGETGPVRIALYDLQGREVRRFELTDESAGEHSLRIEAGDLASGVYFAQIVTRSQQVSLKLLLLK